MRMPARRCCATIVRRASGIVKRGRLALEPGGHPVERGVECGWRCGPEFESWSLRSSPDQSSEPCPGAIKNDAGLPVESRAAIPGVGLGGQRRGWRRVLEQGVRCRAQRARQAGDDAEPGNLSPRNRCAGASMKLSPRRRLPPSDRPNSRPRRSSATASCSRGSNAAWHRRDARGLRSSWRSSRVLAAPVRVRA